jgi:hypothetical protein
MSLEEPSMAMKFAIFKGQIQFALQKRPGSLMSLAKIPFEFR